MTVERRWWPLVVFFTGNVCFVAGIIVHTFSFIFYLRELGYSAAVMGRQVTAMTLTREWFQAGFEQNPGMINDR